MIDARTAEDWMARYPWLSTLYGRAAHAGGLVLGAALLPFNYWRKPTVDHRDDLTDSYFIEKLEARLNLYRHLIKDEQGFDGFIETDHCDATLFSGLVAAAGVNVDLLAARDEDGRWYRRTLALPECYACGGSRSTISRDMFIGIMWWGWRTKNLEAMEAIYQYGSKNSWVMGLGPASRTVMSPALRSTLAEMIYRMGGANHRIARSIPVSFSETNTDFAAHLDVLHILLRGEIRGGLTEDELGVLAEQSDRQPNNPLFQYAWHAYYDGIQDAAAHLLLNETLWPAHRLPMGVDRREPWLPQRDHGPDWEPNQEDPRALHSGGDFIFVADLVLRY